MRAHIVPVLCTALLPFPATAQSTTRAHVATSGLPGNGSAFDSQLSSDGRWLLIQSSSTNLGGAVRGLPWSNVWLHDRMTGTTSLVSVAIDGGPANQASSVQGGPRLVSPDGRLVLFTSVASNLVASDLTPMPDVFVRDMVTGITAMASTNAAGAQANGQSIHPCFTGDARAIVFESSATNLVTGDSNAATDVFVKDVVTDAVELVSVSSSGAQADAACVRPRISSDGRWVCFVGLATNLVPGDTNGMSDVFLRDRSLGTTERVSVTASGLQANSFSDFGSVSDDGSRVMFFSGSSNLVPNDANGLDDFFVRDRAVSTTIRVNISTNGAEATLQSQDGTLSADGRWALFASDAPNLVPNDGNGSLDVFRYDLQTGIQARLSVSSVGHEATGDSRTPRASANGSVVSFVSGAVDLIAGDANHVGDVFVRDLPSTAAPVTSYCTAKTSSSGCVPAIGTSGIASATAGDNFRLCTGMVPPSVNGVFFWGVTAAAVPFGGGTLCIAPPVVRSPVQNSGVGHVPIAGCSGATAWALTCAELQSHGVVPGEDVHAQYWYRDAGFTPPNNVGLTDAVTFRFEP
ncbi:MAG: PD40 domain-containing protein [Planctomycetes bacterium]|nr:PD40 domain-containing protein [Planctomycetota bacterium]